MKPTALHSHVWSDDESAPHQINQDGKVILHRRCTGCGRDFAREVISSEWQAARLGAFRIEFLAKSVTEIWVNQECPGQILETDIEQRRVRRG
jgi:hypothetical protein